MVPDAKTVQIYEQLQAETLSPLEPRLPKYSSVSPPTNRNAAAKSSVPNNLRTPLAAFVGRQKELDIITQRIIAPDCRLLTIVGSGGMGKTTLALEAGLRLRQSQSTDFSDGIYFVALSGIEITSDSPGDSPDDSLGDSPGDETDAYTAVGAAIVAAIADQIGCKRHGALPVQMQLQNFLHARRLLLILDNFEHLLEGATAVVTLLTTAPHIKALITSRARLNVRGESLLRLDKLSLSTVAHDANITANQFSQRQIIGNETWRESEAVAMFVQRTQQLDPYFTINAETITPVIQICHLLDGLPLGIELATSMLSMLSCTALADELAEGLEFLTVETRDLPREQRSLRAVFERSWRLLSSQEQSLLAMLSIFPTTFGRDAAKVIAGATLSLLMRLINQSLVGNVSDDRYTIHRSIREFGQEKLAQWPTAAETSHSQHACYYLGFLAQKEPGLMGSEGALTAKQILVEIDNVRAAWRWAVTYQMVAELVLGLRALFLFQEQLGLFTDAFDLYTYALRGLLPCRETLQRTPAGDAINILIGRLYTYLGWSNARLGHLLEADAAFRSGFSILQQGGYLTETVACLTLWGGTVKERNLHEAQALLNKALDIVHSAKPDTIREHTKVVLHLLFGETKCVFGDYVDAKRLVTDGYMLSKQLDWSWGLVNGCKIGGFVELYLGNYAVAETLFRDCIALANQEDQKVVLAEATLFLGDALRLQERLDEAQQCFVESQQLAEESQFDLILSQVCWMQGCLAVQREEYATAKALFTESLATRHSNYYTILPTLGWALIGLGELDDAERYFRDVLTEAQARHCLPVSLDAQAGLAYIHEICARSTIQTHPDVVKKGVHILQSVYRNLGTTQETRDRIAKIAAELGIQHQVLSRNNRYLVDQQKIMLNLRQSTSDAHKI